MSEHNLWERFRNNLGHTGHLTRIEYNVVDGVPDVSFCFGGKEGYIELKFCDAFPARPTSMVFGGEGLRDSQVAWIHTRVRHGGRVWILAQVDDMIFLVHGRHCRKFNRMTAFQIKKAADWETPATMTWNDWRELRAMISNG